MDNQNDKAKITNKVEREEDPSVLFVSNEDSVMNLAIARARQTVEHFVQALQKYRYNFTVQNFSVKAYVQDEEGSGEHIWLIDPNYDEHTGAFVGTINNNPINVRSIQIGDKLTVSKGLISDWMYVEGGVLVGGYTLRVLRDAMQEEERRSFDQSIGFVIEDEVEMVGEDAQSVALNLETPAGALCLLERAYQTDDLELAISCKDFEIEASLMFKDEFKDLNNDDELKTHLLQKATMLKDLFVKAFQSASFRDFEKIQRLYHTAYSGESIAHILEEITFEDGQKKVVNINAIFTEGGWKILTPIN